MRCFIKSVQCFVLALGFSIMMPAQELPALQKDAAVTSGSLNNGISYYLVTNPSTKGVADFALVRKGICDTLSARKELASLPHFNRTSPQKFLSSKGIGCRPEGFASYRDGSTVFRFDDVPVFDQAASDTTLLMLFDLIAAQPSQHAIIVAGDITPSAIIEKMNVFSLMVPSRSPSYKKPEYVWKHSDEPEYSFTPSATSSVTVTFRSPRTPDSQMNTIQPFISRLFAESLKEIVAGRLRETLISRNIRVSAFDISYEGSDSGPGDETFRVSLNTSRSQLIPASLAVASTLSDLASKGAGEEEYKAAKSDFLKDCFRFQDNDALVRRCISAYLYGADLASFSSKAGFYTSRNMSPQAEAGLFNGFATALLSDTGNSRIDWTGNEQDYDEWSFRTVYESAWNGVSLLPGSLRQWKVSAKDTSGFWNEKNKVKLKSAAAETVSGGEMWTFSNGMRVLFKKGDTKRRFNYSLMIKGGYSTVRNLQRGEGAFFSDMLGNCRIAGMSGEDFDKVLKANGVEMICNVSSSDLRISGSASTSRLQLVLKALLSVANQRKPSEEAFASWRSFERGLLGPAVLDSLMYPDYNYSAVKTRSGLVESTLADASGFFDNQFVRSNDGVLVIVGDFAPEQVQKVLGLYLGGFRVSRIPAVRQSVAYKMRTGATTYSKVGKPVSLSIGMACAEPFTTESYMAFKVAGLALQRRLNGVMAGLGFSVSLADRFSVWPQEALEMVFTFAPVPESGLPYGVEGGEKHPSKALVAARRTIEDVLSKPVDNNELQACKSLLVNGYSTFLADSANYVDAVLMRFSGGKDVLTGYNARIASVSADKVKEIFGALSGGMRIEYVVKE